MCGIFCAINLNSNFSSSDYERFIKLTNKVEHRGPDSSGYLALNIHDQKVDPHNFNIFLGHRRLSIIDLSNNANQPMIGKGTFMVYNGEIFNYLEIKDELIKKGVKFDSRSDSEVILKLYENFNENSFNKLNGMWAFIIVDLNRKRIVISKDRFSIKPLYKYRNGNEFYFASELKQLIPLLSRKTINENSLISFLYQGLMDLNEETFFLDIKRIRPKFNVIIDLNTKAVTENPYWDYSSEELGGKDEIMNKFNEIINDSIKIRLRSDVKIGVLLSGGLDSSSIALLAKPFLETELNTYSVVSKEKKYSEEKFIDLFNAITKIKNNKLYFVKEDMLSHLDEVLYYQDEPFASFSIIAQYLIFKNLKNNSDTTVVLSGQGADEILLGYLRYYLFYLKDLQKEKRYTKLLLTLFYTMFHGEFIRQFRLNNLKRYFILKQDKNNFIKKKYNYQLEWKNWPMNEKQKADIDKYSVPILTRYEDRNSMSQSLEVRLPFLDHRLVNFMVNLPTNFKINHGWNKFILRESMKNLPKEIRWRKDKKGFITADEKWLKIDLVDEVRATFNKSILHEMDIIEKRGLLHYYDSYLQGNKFIHNFDISRFYITEKWLQKII